MCFSILIAGNICDGRVFVFKKKASAEVHHIYVYVYIWCINNRPYLWHAWGTIRGQQAWGSMTSSLSIGTIIATYSTLVFSKTDFYSRRTAFTLFYWIYFFVVEILQNGKKIKIFNYIFYLLIFWSWEAVNFFLMLGFPFSKPVLCVRHWYGFKSPHLGLLSCRLSVGGRGREMRNGEGSVFILGGVGRL